MTHDIVVPPPPPLPPPRTARLVVDHYHHYPTPAPAAPGRLLMGFVYLVLCAAIFLLPPPLSFVPAAIALVLFLVRGLFALVRRTPPLVAVFVLAIGVLAALMVLGVA